MISCRVNRAISSKQFLFEKNTHLISKCTMQSEMYNAAMISAIYFYFYTSCRRFVCTLYASRFIYVVPSLHSGQASRYFSRISGLRQCISFDSLVPCEKSLFCTNRNFPTCALSGKQRRSRAKRVS